MTEAQAIDWFKLAILKETVFKQAVSDVIPGGKGDKLPDSAVPRKNLEEGQSHELEHTGSKSVAKEIAKDHLAEDVGYYEKLEELEKQPKQPPDLKKAIRWLQQELVKETVLKQAGDYNPLDMFTSTESDWRPREGAFRLMGTGGLVTAMIAQLMQARAMHNATKKLPHMTEQGIQKMRRIAKMPEELKVGPDPLSEGNAYYDPSTKSIGYGSDMKRHAILAHEMGHADMHLNKPWYSPSRINQSFLRPASDLVGAIAGPTVGLGVGIGTGNPLLGAAAGGLTGGILNLPTLINEHQASSRAKKYLQEAQLAPSTQANSKDALNKAWRTYLLGATLPAAAGGAIAGITSHLNKTH